MSRPLSDLYILMREAREETGLTQKQVAERLGVKQQSYATLESAKTNPSMERYMKAFKALGKRLVLIIEPMENTHD